MSLHHVRLTRVAAGLSFGAASIHLIVTDEHFLEWWGYGAFFLVAAAAQALYGFALLTNGPPGTAARAPYSPEGWLRVRRSIFLAGIFGNASIVALYLVTRTVGIPLLGPEAGKVEDVRVIGLVSKALEVALILCLWVLLRADQAGPAGENRSGSPTLNGDP